MCDRCSSHSVYTIQTQYSFLIISRSKYKTHNLLGGYTKFQYLNANTSSHRPLQHPKLDQLPQQQTRGEVLSRDQRGSANIIHVRGVKKDAFVLTTYFDMFN